MDYRSAFQNYGSKDKMFFYFKPLVSENTISALERQRS